MRESLGRIRNFAFLAMILILQLGSIQSQITNCEKVQNGICLSCNQGYALNSNRSQCITSPVPNCIYLNSYNKCIECTCGYASNESGSQCVSSEIEGCRQVNVSSKCIKAKPYFMLTPQGVYFNQNSNCAVKSNIWITADCSECHEGYFLKNGYCEALPNISSYSNLNAAILKLDSSGKLSLNCQSGWYSVNDGVVSGCFLTIQNCVQHGQSGLLSTCIQCETQYYAINGGSSCTKSVNQRNNCLEIDSLTTYKCVRCNSNNLKVNAAGECGTRQTFLPNCNQHDPLADKCIQCTDTYYVKSDGTCEARQNNNKCVKYVVNADKCLTCVNAQAYYSAQTQTCIDRTSPADPNCDQLELQKDQCAQCKVGYTLYQGTCTLKSGLTDSCIERKATDQTKCVTCYYDFILQSDGICKDLRVELSLQSLTVEKQVIEIQKNKCLEMDISGVCVKCTKNYGIAKSSKLCYDNFRNIPLCNTYVANDPTTCEKCEDDFILTNDKKQCLIPIGSCKYKETCTKYNSNLKSYEQYSCIKELEDDAHGSHLKFYSSFLILVFFLSQIF